MSVFSQKIQDKIKHYLTRYETKRSSILPILHEIQDEYGWIKEEHVEALDREFGLAKVQVQEVVTFYSMYRTTEPKQFRILFCDNIVCNMMGAKDTMGSIKQYIKNLEREGKECHFSLQGVPCLGVCDGAPAMLVNKDRYLKVTPEKADEILKSYQEKA